MKAFSRLCTIAACISICGHGLDSVCNAQTGSFSVRDSAIAGEQQTLLAHAFASIIEASIPREYEKRKDWGRTKDITVGLRNDGWKIHRRKKAVKHGVWKHYKVRLVEPEQQFDVQVQSLRMESGKLCFTLALQAKLDLWSRLKVYQYGVHMVALEIVGDAAINLAIDCQLEMHWQTAAGQVGVALDPQVTDSRLVITDFHLQRISNAHGPLVRELGEEIPDLIHDQLHGARLTQKLNRAVDKKRDRLEISIEELIVGRD